MIKRFTLIIYYILKFFDKVFLLLFKRGIFRWIKDFIHEDSYKKLNIDKKKIIFFIPNQLTEWRVDTFFTKEPETLEWINSFEKKKIVFWDIGANIGLYSIYNAIKNEESNTISFEPSSSNLRTLTRNISINNLENRIKIFPIALNNKENSFLQMNEKNFVEGGALNSFGSNLNFEGKEFNAKMKYYTFGTTINYLLVNKILDFPNYIKIDVDGLEHLILEGASKLLDSNKLKSLSIEINENYKVQYDKILNIMKDKGYRILHKKHNAELIHSGSAHSKTFNYIFLKR